jgi:hypothetical protein
MVSNGARAKGYKPKMASRVDEERLMLHFDYSWDLSPNGIILDNELNVDKLGWKGGDYFQLVNIDGRCYLKKVDPLVKFLKDGENGQVD